jgi:hypothetical protein
MTTQLASTTVSTMLAQLHFGSVCYCHDMLTVMAATEQAIGNQSSTTSPHLQVLLVCCVAAGTACFIHVMNNISIARLTTYTVVNQPSSWLAGYFNVSNNLFMYGRQWVL